MSFQSIEPVEKPDFYIDQAFGEATKAASMLKGKKLKLVRHEIIKKVELTKIGTINRSIIARIGSLTQSFPSTDQLTPFYSELLRNVLDVSVLKRSLATLNWITKKSNDLTDKYVRLINNTKQPEKMLQYRREYYGRISSLFSKTKPVFDYLHEARKVFRSFPVVKDIPTITICGFPNIGKTTLLTKLTTADPKIAAYPFTTKTLNMGYTTINQKKVQFVDTPGTLNRFDNMNYIEQQAYLVAKHCADVIVYIFDLSEPYSLVDQKKLLKRFQEFQKPVLIYLSKTDILPKELISEFNKDNNYFTDIKKLRHQINKEIKEVLKVREQEEALIPQL